MQDYSYSAQSFTIRLDQKKIYCGRTVDIMVVPISTAPFLVTVVDTSFQATISPPFKPARTVPVKLYANCNGCLSHIFTEPGTHRIVLLLNGVHIDGSPFSLEVQPNISIPIPRWMLGDMYLDSGTSTLVEAYYQKASSKLPVITTGEYHWTVDFANNKAQRRNWFGILVEESLFRYTWFWTDDNDQLVPYTLSHALALEAGLVNGKEEKVFVNESEKKKVRWVKKEGVGEYRQYRLKFDAKPEGRKVFRGYFGKTLDLTPIPLIWPFKRVLLRGLLERGSLLFNLPVTAFVAILGYAQQSEVDQYALLLKD